MKITIDKELKEIFPPLTQVEINNLTSNIIEEGCRDPLVLWGDTLIDGHNRYSICTKNNIPFKIIRKKFDSRNEAILWMIKNQIGRRSLNAYSRISLSLRVKKTIASMARSNTFKNKTTKYNTNVIIGQIAGFSNGQVAKVNCLEKHADKKTQELLRTNEISITDAYSQVILKRNGTYSKTITSTLTDKQYNDLITLVEMRGCGVIDIVRGATLLQ